MKKLFSAGLLVMLCCMVNSSFAQNDSLCLNAKTGSRLSKMEVREFDLEEDLRLMTLLTNALEKDGLIDRRNAYKLEIKEGQFYINDKRQAEVIRDKFKKYFRADTTDHYTIINNGDKSASTSDYNDIQKDNPKSFTNQDSKSPWFDADKYGKDLALMTQLISGLEKDGLLNTKMPYKLEVKVGELYINGRKQPAEVSDKFRKYFQSNNYALSND